jgi:Nif-specific regulatory protein
MAATTESSELVQTRRERDLYLRLLRLGHAQELAPFLKEALALVVELTGSSQGYMELQDPEDQESTPRWWIAHGFSDDQVPQVRQAISRGIIAEAIATGQTIATQSAQLDPRFSERQSVRSGKIEAVVCAPVGRDPPRGVIYLQHGSALGPYTEEDRARVQLFAHHLAPFVDRLLLQERTQAATDPTQPWRKRLRLAGLVGRSNALAAVLKQVELVAPLDVAVLLTGESGTGKTQLARAIHDNGPRAQQPFVELNCAALPDELIENELFGALRGAHSTATRRIEGKIAAAERGTLFLDEIGEFSFAVQAKLLQLLQSKQYYPLGSAQPMQADVRVIAATNTDLQRAVAERRFREDLFYRLQVVPIRVPALVERREDIPLLAAFFCEQACTHHHLPNLLLSPNAVHALQAAEWPGNVRQLAHTVEAAVIRARGDGVLRVECSHLFPESTPAPAAPRALTFQEATRRFQQELILQALDATDWNVSEAARRLDVTRTHVYNLIRAFGLQRQRG